MPLLAIGMLLISCTVRVYDQRPVPVIITVVDTVRVPMPYVTLAEDLVNKALTDLEPKKNHLIKQLLRIGLSATQLNSQSIIKLFYGFYNPSIKGQKFDTPINYEAPVVAPNMDS